jgi:hypothetical protein
MRRSWDEEERVKKDKEAQAVDLIEKYYKWSKNNNKYIYLKT